MAQISVLTSVIRQQNNQVSVRISKTEPNPNTLPAVKLIDL